jgi:hypothetical protein
MQIHIIFSAFGKASNFPILESIQEYKNINIICLTSRAYKKSWQSMGITTYYTFLNPMSKLSKLFRYIIRNKIMLSKQVSKVILNHKILRDTVVVPHNLRHFLSLEVISELNPKDFVFLVDARDLIFQVSPIIIARKLDNKDVVHLFDEGVSYFRNNLPQDFINSKSNFEWIQQLLNYPDSFDNFDLKNPIINSGCIAGRVKNLTKLLNETTILISNSKNGIGSLLDQAALNVVAYRKFLDKNSYKVNKNGKIVLNMCGIINEHVEIEDGKIRLNAQVIPIIHQFDRFGTYSSPFGIKISRREYKSIGIETN